MPARVPAVTDFLLPVLLAVCEFMLFTVLGYRLTGWTTPRAVLAGWWFTLATFSLIALFQVRRAYYLIDNAKHSAAVNDIASYQLKRLRSNMRGAATATSLVVVSGGYYVIVARPSLQLGNVLVAASVVVHTLGLAAHAKTAKALRSALEQLPDEPINDSADSSEPRASMMTSRQRPSPASEDVHPEVE